MTINYSSKETRRVSAVYVHNNPFKRVGKANPFFKAAHAVAAPVVVLFKA